MLWGAVWEAHIGSITATWRDQPYLVLQKLPAGMGPSRMQLVLAHRGGRQGGL